jgi:hypothetical protein
MNIQLQKKQEIDIDKPMTTEEQLADLKLKVDSMSQMFYMLRKLGLESKEKNSEEAPDKNPLLNKDDIPVNTCFVGYTRKSPHPYILLVNEKGEYMLGTKIFDSLSSAAEFVSGVRRSGWTFWCTLDGQTAKEVYRPNK